MYYNRFLQIHLIVGLFFFSVSFISGCESQKSIQDPSNPTTVEEHTLIYPNTHKGEQIDDYHGTKIADPYRWLEDPDSEETKKWVQAQNKLTFGYLEKIPQRKQLKEDLTKLWNYERFSVPRKRGKHYFYSHNDGLQNQSVLYVTESLDAEPRMLLDPNTLSEDGTIALAGTSFSDDGRYLAYAIAKAGSDWREWKVRDVQSGIDLEDQLLWSKFSGASWRRDGSGFYYSRYDKPEEGEEFTEANYFQKLYFHQLGTQQSEDKLVYERNDRKEWGFDGYATEDGQYLIITVWKGTLPKNQVFYKDLSKPDSPVVELISGFDAEYEYVDNEGPIFWFTTDFQAPQRRIITIDTQNAERENWQELIAEATDVLQVANVVGNRLFVSYLKDASTQFRVFDLQGKPLGEVKLPGIGSAGGFGGRREETETFYSYGSFTQPSTIYRYNVTSGKSTIFREPKVDFDPTEFETKQIFYESKDGTKVPMFISSKKGLKLDGNNPALLYGYGGFNISLTPGFSVSNITWMQLGGIYAVPNLRGGGEYGRKWYEAGMKDKKQNVFDDFIAAAQWLIDNKYTNREKLAISGGSNGGLLVGAAMTQRPDLFAAALPAVGVMDMLRYHQFTIGWAWTSEYGSSENAEEFNTLLAYSPLHNLKPGTSYPATMVTTADHDDRVVPAHSFKFAATLQAAHDGKTPTLIRIETKAGHGAGKPTSKRIEEAADRLAFLIKELGL